MYNLLYKLQCIVNMRCIFIKFVCVLFIIACGVYVQAQDISPYNNNLSNATLYNPSFTGIGPASATMSYSSRYLNFPGETKYFFFNAHTPFANQRMGTGVNLHSRSTGIYNVLSLSTAYAYHFKMNEDMGISLGVAAGNERISLGNNVGFCDSPEPSYEIIPLSHNPFIALGASFRYKSINVGISSFRQNIFEFITADVPNIARGRSFNAWFTMDYHVVENVVFRPYLAYKYYNVPVPAKWEGGLYITLDQRFVLGGAYKHEEQKAYKGGRFYTTLGVHIFKRYHLAYNFVKGGAPTTVLGATAHEFTLHVALGRKQKESDNGLSLAFQDPAIE